MRGSSWAAAMSRAPALSAAAPAGGGDGCGGGGGGGWAAAWDEWQCPVCMELMDKPTVSECGHVSCFWCHHHSACACACARALVRVRACACVCAECAACAM